MSYRPTKNELAMFTVKELKDECKAKGYVGYSGLKKHQLFNLCLGGQAPHGAAVRPARYWKRADLVAKCKSRGYHRYSGLSKSELWGKCVSPRRGSPSPVLRPKRKGQQHKGPTVKDLMVKAKRLGIQGRSKMKRAQLMAAISRRERLSREL